MTVLVTGATGFIGSAVARELSEKGTKIRCLVRETSSMKNLDGLYVEIAHGDISDIDSVHRAMKGCDSVYHLAAVYANWLPDPGLMYRVNEEGTRNVLTACREAGIQKIVYCSSVAALGAHGKTPADESAQFNLNSTKDHYFISKYRAEQVALEFSRTGLPVVTVNPSSPIGVRDIAPTPTGALIINLLKGKFPGYVDGGINLIDVTDCARGIVAAMEKGQAGQKYILGNRNVSIKAYFDLIVKVAGKGKSPALRIPSWMAVYSGWGDSTKAREELDLGQRPLEESIADAIIWFETNGYL